MSMVLGISNSGRRLEAGAVTAEEGGSLKEGDTVFYSYKRVEHGTVYGVAGANNRVLEEGFEHVGGVWPQLPFKQ